VKYRVNIFYQQKGTRVLRASSLLPQFSENNPKQLISADLTAVIYC